MDKIPEFLKNNDHYLKSCILYEVLQKKPIHNSYQNFCSLVGQDAMNYPDFEFWYHRFCQGELDFDYDRSKDPVPKTLMDMPVKLMQKITEELRPFERCYLRSMNHDLKNFTDSFPTVLEKISIDVSDKELEWRVNKRIFEFEKRENDNSSFLTPKMLNSKKVEKSYIQKGLEYLTPFFKIPNIQTNDLCLMVKVPTPELDDLLPVPFCAKEAFILAYNFEKMVEFLLSLKAGHLETLRLEFKESTGRENWNRVFETDQFKQAQLVQINCDLELYLEDLMSFSHLKRFSCGLKTIIGLEEILIIRDIVSTFKDLLWCKIRYHRNGSPEEIPEELSTYRYNNPESNKTLEFKIEESGEDYCFIDVCNIP